MHTIRMFAIASCLTVMGLLLASCAPAVTPTPTPRPAPTEEPAAAPTAPAAPAVTKAPAAVPTPKPAAPAPTPKPAAEQPKRGGTLRVLINADPRTYDLHSEISYSVIAPVGPAYNGLVEYDDQETSKIVPGLAEKWETSADGRVFTFRLRKGVKWHDGKSFTVSDAEYSLKRILANSPRLKEPLAFVDKVEAVSEDALRVTLREPRGLFMVALADSWAAILPEHVIKARGDMKRSVVGTGPFKFLSHSVGASMNMVRNPEYFEKGKPYLDGLVFYPIRDVSTAKAAFKTNRVDITGIIVMAPVDFVTLQKEVQNAHVARYESSGWYTFNMPVNKAPWSDIRVRRAVYLAIDRETFVKIGAFGAGRTGSFLPPIMGGPRPDELKGTPGFKEPKDADLAEAKRLLEQAGYSSGFSTEMLHRTGEPYASIAVLMQNELAKIGISVALKGRTEADIYELAYQGAYDSFMISTAWTLPDPDGLLPANYRSTSVRNYSRLVDTETDKLIDGQSITSDPVKRKEILREIDRRLTDTLPAVVTHWWDHMVAWWPARVHYVQLYTFTSNVRYAGAWLSQ